MSFLANKLRERELFIKKTASLNDQGSLLSDLYSTFTTMSSVGVNDEKDYRDFFYILTHVPTLSKEILNRKLNNVELSKISHVVYANRDNFPINTICNFYKAVGEAIDKTESIKKIAYPQEYGFSHISKQHNLSKWVQSMRQIYAFKSRGMGGLEAFNKVTEKWDVMEKRDFKNWLNFYESKGHLSYKLAADPQVYYEVGGVPLPMGPRQQPAEEEIVEEIPRSDDLSNVVKQLLGRIASAEKIYTDPYKSPIFRKLLGAEYEAWLTTLHQLKRKIQTLEFKNASTLVDVIERFGNQLRAQGMVKTASLMVKVAQGAPPPAGDAPPPVGGGDAPPPPPGPSDAPPPELDMLGGPPEGAVSSDDASDPDAAMEEFLENIGVQSNKAKEKEEKEEIYAADDEASIVVSEEDYDLFKTAQMAPAPLPPPNAPPHVPSHAAPAKHPVVQQSTEDILDSALKSVTIVDVIKELEEISVLYKNRPLSMKLTKVDLMMQHLGLSPYFPNMAEAMKSSLDSNQYVLTRIDDVLAKLRGAQAAGSGKLEELQDTLDKSEETMAQKRQQKAVMEMQPPPEAPPVPGAPPEEAPVKEPIKEAPELKRPVEVAPPQPGVRI